MKKILKNSSVKLVFSLVFLTLTYASCKKDKPVTQSTSDVAGTSISSAKQSFEKNSKIIEPNYTGESFLSKELLGKRKLDWDNAFSQSNGDTVAVFVPVKLDARITLEDGGLSGTRLDNLLYLRLMTTSKAFDGSEAQMISMIPDQVWEKDKNFSGHMFIENWFVPNLSVVSRTRNSTIPTNSTEHKPGDKVVNGFPQCYTAIETACVGAGDGQTCYTTTHTACAGGGGGNGGSGGGSWGGGGNSGGVSGGGGGTGTPGGGGGGAGGGGNGGTSGSIANKDIIDSLRGYPCAQALVARLSTLKSDIPGLIKKTFSVSDEVNLTFEPDKRLIGSTTDGRFNSASGSAYVIGLNPDVLKNASKEYILVTLYHEALHAYFAEKKERLGEAEFNRQFLGMNVNGGRLVAVQDQAHMPMGYDKYIRGLADVVIAFNPSYDRNRALALAQGGIIMLSNVDSQTNSQEKDTSKPGYTGSKCP
ncbi:hypothetical protein AY601_2042 [Pedobacter cryoconitis]|uniref:SprT-like family protein n=1 Tax=Pedobacter cryoconitis TaxID=188932 RepID=A0A127VC67_9SPHI|nr:hypothetical protein [Pedobacter cryoconitis]AMP98946.1 hypothetical protein AY601_2042 [Pedobacter cryoconitis]